MPEANDASLFIPGVVEHDAIGANHPVSCAAILVTLQRPPG